MSETTVSNANGQAAGSDAAEAADGEQHCPLTDEARAERMQALISVIELMRPVVQQDGGDLALVSADPETGVVEVRLQGSCSSCAVSSTTLQAGVSRILRDRLPWVTEVRGGVEEMDYEASRAMGTGGYVPKYEY